MAEPTKVESPKLAADADIQKALDYLNVLEKHAIEASKEPADNKELGLVKGQPKAGYNPHFYINKVLFPARQALAAKGVTSETVSAILALKKEDEPTVKKYYSPVIKQ